MKVYNLIYEYIIIWQVQELIFSLSTGYREVRSYNVESGEKNAIGSISVVKIQVKFPFQKIPRSL